ncbi:MAG: hypothetical protein L6Q92_00680 [Phycisphaerae bacterium]|nr:hypothetical protein [Phycisphaerae bacterium]
MQYQPQLFESPDSVDSPDSRTDPACDSGPAPIPFDRPYGRLDANDDESHDLPAQAPPLTLVLPDDADESDDDASTVQLESVNDLAVEATDDESDQTTPTTIEDEADRRAIEFARSHSTDPPTTNSVVAAQPASAARTAPDALRGHESDAPESSIASLAERIARLRTGTQTSTPAGTEPASIASAAMQAANHHPPSRFIMPDGSSSKNAPSHRPIPPRIGTGQLQPTRLHWKPGDPFGGAAAIAHPPFRWELMIATACGTALCGIAGIWLLKTLLS